MIHANAELQSLPEPPAPLEPKRWRLAGFGAPQLPLAALGLPLAVYLPGYYASSLHTPLAAVGAAFLSVRLIDIGVDPLVGALMDRTRSRFGRFRPWLAAGAPILMLGVWFLFMARPGVGAAHLTASLAVLYLGFSILVVGHFSWASTLSAAYHGRSRVFAWLQGLIVVGVLVALALPAALSSLAHTGMAGVMHAMGWLIIGLTPLSLGVAFACMGEPDPGARGEAVRARDYLDLFKSAAVRRLLATDVSIQLMAQTTGVLFFFYFEQVKHFTQGQAGVLLLAYFLGGLAGSGVWAALAGRIGKHRALAVAAVCYSLSQVIALVSPAGDLPWGLALMAVAGLPYSAAGVLVRAMLADLGDEHRLARGHDRASLFYALQNAETKLAAAVAVGLSFPLLALIGFRPEAGVVNSAQALAGLRLLFIAVPGALGLLAAWLSLGYSLTAGRHAEIRAALAIRDAGQTPVLPLPPLETPHDAPAP